jgi:hypothetical protein
MRLRGLNKTFFGLPLATLQELQTDFTACLKAIAVAGSSYSIAGRAFTRANLSEVAQTLKELQAAIDNAQNKRTTKYIAGFSTQRP